ncbi:MAG TPA: DMT family transporter [Chloroflexi bacterium]|nr:DMT family transporter [Chloroflexota bacterium]
MGIFWGLVAALTWGVTDFLIKSAATQIGAIRAAFYVELLSLIPLGGYYLLAGGRITPDALPSLGLALLIGVINALATLALYRAYQIGEVSTLAPIVSTFSVITVVLALVVLAERPSPLHSLGIALTLLGVIAVSTSRSVLRHVKYLFTAPGVGWALASALGFGLAFFLLDYVVEGIGYIAPVVAFRLTGALGFLGLALAGRLDLKIPGRKVWPVLVMLVVADTLGYLAYNLGISTAYVSLVSTLSSLYALISVMLALIFLKERLEVNQQMGVAAVALGIVLVLA